MPLPEDVDDYAVGNSLNMMSVAPSMNKKSEAYSAEDMEIPIDKEVEESTPPLLFVEEMPEFKDGMQALTIFMFKTLVYPKQAVENGISGIVFVNFLVCMIDYLFLD